MTAADEQERGGCKSEALERVKEMCLARTGLGWGGVGGGGGEGEDSP